jgi:hypothetical protein
MISKTTLAPVLALTALAIIGGSFDADAHKRRYKHSHYSSVCKDRMFGFATGQGILGLGTQQARSIAIADWQSKVADRYGGRYSNMSNARNVVWTCNKLAILQAKCTVSAKPCR